MTDARGYTWAGPTPPLPRSIWVVAWASLAGQIVFLLDRGVRSDSEIAVAASLLVGALVIGYVSAGVVRARTVRLVLAWLVLGLSGIAELVFVIDHASYGAPEDSEFLIALAGLATTTAALVGLWRFQRSSWFAWHRHQHRHRLPTPVPVTALVAIGVLVGVLGGLVGPTATGTNVEPRIGVPAIVHR